MNIGMGNMNEKILLTIDIRFDSIQFVHGTTQSVAFVRFSGSAYGDYFNGTIEPGAVDAQIVSKGDLIAALSEQFLLKGKDRNGNDCQIFIQNSGNILKGFTTKIFTDSPILSDWETSVLHSRITGTPDGEQIKVWRLTDELSDEDYLNLDDIIDSNNLKNVMTSFRLS